jgi:ArsR family transcriptional regulator
MADAVRLAEIFKIFSVEARTKIVLALKRRGMSVTELESQIGITQEATSQHLRILREAKIVAFQKRGFHVYYSIDKQNFDLIRKTVEAFFEL